MGNYNLVFRTIAHRRVLEVNTKEKLIQKDEYHDSSLLIDYKKIKSIVINKVKVDISTDQIIDCFIEYDNENNEFLICQEMDMNCPINIELRIVINNDEYLYIYDEDEMLYIDIKKDGEEKC